MLGLLSKYRSATKKPEVQLFTLEIYVHDALCRAGQPDWPRESRVQFEAGSVRSLWLGSRDFLRLMTLVDTQKHKASTLPRH